MESDIYLDLSYIPRYISSSMKQFASDERHISRYNRQNILIFVFEGVLCFEEDGEEITLGAGEYYIQASGRWQTGNRPSEKPRYCYINFAGQFTESSERSIPVRGRFDPLSLEPLCQRLCDTRKSLALGADVEALFLVQTLFFDVLNAIRKGSIDLTRKKTLAEQIHAYLTEHFTEEVSVSSLATRFNYSKDHIIRVFKSMYRITPHQYLTQCRICYSKILLSSEGMSVADAAAECGFADVSSFYRAFVRLEGISPAQYKELSR